MTILGALDNCVNKLWKSWLSKIFKKPGSQPNLWSEDFVLICRNYPVIMSIKLHLSNKIQVGYKISPFKGVPYNAVK